MNCQPVAAFSVSIALVIGAAFSLEAQTLPDVKTAQKLLFSTRTGAVVVRAVTPGLMAGLDVKQIKKNAPYYSSFAASPSSGLTGPGSSAALNFHSIESANQTALHGCNKKKKKPEKPCVVVMEIVPAKYKGPVAFQLNGNATDEFKKKYKRGKSPKAFAISEATGQWGYHVKAGSPDNARNTAIAACQVKAKASGSTGEDCVVVSEE